MDARLRERGGSHQEKREGEEAHPGILSPNAAPSTSAVGPRITSYSLGVARDAFPPLPIEQELIAEKASALARITGQLEAALAALVAADEKVAAAPAEERAALLAQRSQLREAARRQLWYLVVQREAIGLRDHEGLYRYHRIPAELKVFAGPQRQS
jgi:hypothetical protein